MEEFELETEKVYLIQPVESNDSKALREEAESLIESAGAVCAGAICPVVREINPATYIGPGKLAELRERLEGLDLTILFNGELSPSQTLNISAALDNRKVIDRTTLILDIFARHAQSNEGKLQVELAQLKYIYPRLRGKGIGLSRLGGGIGTRGPGETKLETDRRRIRTRIDLLEKKIAALSTRRDLTSSRRTKNNVKTVALIGYTNVGKSTLLNKLTQSEVYADDKLFATLDTTARRCKIDGREFVLTDTVGFLRELPHNLISAFRSTLDSALSCDLALLVYDALGDYEMQIKTTLAALDDMGRKVPYLLVANKSETVSERTAFPSGSIFISARTGAGIDKLKSEIRRFFDSKYTRCILRIPYERMREYGRIKDLVEELSFRYDDTFLEVKANVPNIYLDRFAQFCI